MATLSMEGDYNLAIKSLNESLLRTADFERNLYSTILAEKALNYLKLRKIKLATKLVVEGIGKDKTNSKCWRVKGFIEEFDQQFESASRAYKNCIELEPDDEMALSGLKRCLKANFAIRNNPDAVEKRILNEPDIANIISTDLTDTIRKVLKIISLKKSIYNIVDE